MSSYEEKLKLREEGLSYAEIAARLGISRQAVSQALAKYNPKQFQIIKERSCIYKGLREWMNANKVSVSELCRRMDRKPYSETNARIHDYLNGRIDLKKRDIDKILEVTGMTYEQAFGDVDAAAFVKVVRCEDCGYQSFCGIGHYLGESGFCSKGERETE